MKLYRVRNFGQVADPSESILEYVHPHPVLVTENNRVNRKNTSFFYGSLSVEACLAEMKPFPKVGEHISILTLIKKDDEPLLLCPFGYDESVKEQIELNHRGKEFSAYLNDIQNKTKTPRSQSSLIVGEFFSRVFSEYTKDKKLYNLTIAISEWVLNHDNVHGVIYPSVAFDLACNNVALKNSSMRFLTYVATEPSIYYGKVTKVTDDEISFRTVAAVEKIDFSKNLFKWKRLNSEASKES